MHTWYPWSLSPCGSGCNKSPIMRIQMRMTVREVLLPVVSVQMAACFPLNLPEVLPVAGGQDQRQLGLAHQVAYNQLVNHPNSVRVVTRNFLSQNFAKCKIFGPIPQNFIFRKRRSFGKILQNFIAAFRNILTKVVENILFFSKAITSTSTSSEQTHVHHFPN